MATEKQNCERCNKIATFNRQSTNEPEEGEICGVCGNWVCSDCVDWKLCHTDKIDVDIICKDCSQTS